MLLRLIDLRVNWLLQYVGEITTFDATTYPNIKPRLGQIAGYLQDTRAAILACGRSPADWVRQSDRWQALGDLISRVEAEFPGRILIGPDDYGRFEAEPNALCWMIIQLDDLDVLLRSDADSEPLARFFERGARVFRVTDPVQLDLLSTFGTATGPKPAVDLSQLDQDALDLVLDWFEADPSRRKRIFPVISRSTARLSEGAMTRLRNLHGLIGLSVGPAADVLGQQIETYRSCPLGVQGIGLGTGFLGVETTSPGLGNVEEILNWLRSSFDTETAAALAYKNTNRLIEHLTGF